MKLTTYELTDTEAELIEAFRAGIIHYKTQEREQDFINQVIVKRDFLHNKYLVKRINQTKFIEVSAEQFNAITKEMADDRYLSEMTGLVAKAEYVETIIEKHLH